MPTEPSPELIQSEFDDLAHFEELQKRITDIFTNAQALLRVASKGDSAQIFLNLMVAYRAFYTVGQIGEKILDRAFKGMPDGDVSKCRASIRAEAQPFLDEIERGLV
jgi:hypothetical protein